MFLGRPVLLLPRDVHCSACLAMARHFFALRVHMQTPFPYISVLLLVYGQFFVRR